MNSEVESILMEGDKGGYRQINKSLNIGAFEDYLKGQTAKLPVLPDVEQLSPRVLRVLGQNPGKFTLQGTNTYIVGTGSHRLIIDTSGGEPEWADLIKRTLDTRGITLSHVLITHFHGDHSGGAPDLVRMYPSLKHSVYKNDPEKNQQNITNGQIFRVDGATIRALHVPGHSTDHMCFVLEEEQAMFTGDNILGHGTSAIEDLGVFMTSLQKMLDQNCKIGYTAHGITLNDLASKIKGELSTKLRRERQVVQALNRVRSRGERSASIQDVVAEIYGLSLDEQTRTLALEPFTDEVLRKLAGDGKVAFERRSGKKRWYSVEQAAPRRGSTSKTSTITQVSISAITI
ncbi:beta-lactamase-like protein [Phaeosphaeriaceae sp. PMI808]|nr:beta-lactamase-like protein [Phaeosphaeriaceae sp. PMI808]